jgi:uncharacterized protein with PQ loop repeat
LFSGLRYHGVRGSTPRIPISKTFIKQKNLFLLLEKEEKMSEKKTKEIGEGLGISGMTLGILSVVLAGSPLSLIISIPGFIFCLIQQRNNKTKIGKAGLILNIIGFVLSMIIIYISIKYPSIIPSIGV